MARCILALTLAATVAAGPLPAFDLRVNTVRYAPAIATFLAPPDDAAYASAIFSWKTAHSQRAQSMTAYHLRVFAWQAPGMWVLAQDTGTIASTSQQFTAATDASSFLTPNTRFQWSLQWADNSSVWSTWSANATFATAPVLVNDGDDVIALTGDANITSGWLACPAPGDLGAGYAQLRTEFDLPLTAGVTVTQARLFVAGAGIYHAWVDGAHAGAGMIAPDVESLNMRVRMNAYDVDAAFGGQPPAGDDPALTMYRLYNDSVNGSAFVPYVVGADSPPAPPSRHSLAVLLGWGWSQLGNQYWDGQNMTIDGNGDWVQSGYQRRVWLLLSLRLSNGSSVSVYSPANKSSGAASPWMCGKGALVNASVYDGTTWSSPNDTTGWLLPGYAYTDAWVPALIAAAPGGIISPQLAPLASVVMTFPVMRMWDISPGHHGLDFGQAMGGGVQMTLPAPVPPCVTITLRHSEALLHPPQGPANGSLAYGYLRAAKATDVYITPCNGSSSSNALVYVPVFTWHGFRYADVDWSGMPPDYPIQASMFTALHYRTAFDTRGALSFPTDTDAHILNTLMSAIWFTLSSNSVTHPSDCVSRSERLGWTGDAALAARAMPYLFETGAYYAEWSDAIADGMADVHDAGYVPGGGHVPYVVPHIGPFGASIQPDTAWASVWPTILFQSVMFDADSRRANSSWSQVMLFFKNLNDTASQRGIGALPAAYGDWAPANASSAWEGNWTSRAYSNLTAGAYCLLSLWFAIDVADILNNIEDADSLYSAITALSPKFIDAYKGQDAEGRVIFGSGMGVQTSQALALLAVVQNLSAADAASATQALVDDIQNTYQGHFSTGVLGFAYLHQALTNNGMATVALDTLLVHGFPGPFYSFEEAEWETATTMWELWHSDIAEDIMDSRDQQMWTSVGGWLFRDVLGLHSIIPIGGVLPTAIVRPRVTAHPALSHMSGWHNSYLGNISISWANVSVSAFALNTSIPCGALGTIIVPLPMNATSTSVTLRESGVIVFTNGTFVPGASSGVSGVEFQPASELTALPPALVSYVGSGDFVLLAEW